MLLAFDTAQDVCSVALGRAPGTPPVVVGARMRRGHADALLGMIAEATARAGGSLSGVERIVCGVGPGSFTGVRVAIAAARGLALALDVPATGFSTLESLAAAARAEGATAPVLAAVASRGDTVYAQTFSAAGVPLSAPALLDAASAARRAGARAGLVIGSGAPLLAPHLPAWRVVKQPRMGVAECLLELAMAAPDARWHEMPVPLYLRPPDATPPGPLLPEGGR